MKWEKYGITLSRVIEDDIELIRKWRNHPSIANTMRFKEYITPEMQKKWFDSIDNNNNFFFIISYKEEKIGLINIKNMDWKIRRSEAGIFIWNENYDFAPLLASLLCCEIGFYIINGIDSIARILRTNKKAIEYNSMLGYELYKDDPKDCALQYIMTKESFENKTTTLRNAASNLTGKHPFLYLILEKHDYTSGVAQFFESMINDYKLKFDLSIDNENKTYAFKFD